MMCFFIKIVRAKVPFYMSGCPCEMTFQHLLEVTTHWWTLKVIKICLLFCQSCLSFCMIVSSLIDLASFHVDMVVKYIHCISFLWNCEWHIPYWDVFSFNSCYSDNGSLGYEFLLLICYYVLCAQIFLKADLKKICYTTKIL